MGETPHIVAHYMAAGAGQRLGDYHFLRHTYETVSGQEAQLNRILRMLDQDEIALNWRIDTTPINRGRSRSLYDFDRTGDTTYLPGRIAYQRLREMELEDLKKKPVQSPSGRVPSFRDPRQKRSEHYDSTSNSRSSKSTPSVSRPAESEEIELISFAVHYEDASPSNKGSEEQDPAGRLLCEWVSPSSSSGIDYYTIERQSGDQEWLAVGGKITKSKTEAHLDVSPILAGDENNANKPSCFRLKAHLENGKTVHSKPTGEIRLCSTEGQHIITPNIEILSPSSVRLTWKNNENVKSNMYAIEKREGEHGEWVEVVVLPLSQGSAQIDDLMDSQQCQFRLVPSTSEKRTKPGDESEPDLLTVHNVNEWLGSLQLVPISANTVDVDISEEGFKEFDQYKVEYTTTDQLDQWEKMADITRDVPHLTINNLKQGADYKFRFTPVLRGATANETNSSQLSLVLDVKMPSTKKGRLVKDEVKTRVPPPQFAIHQTDPTSIFIEAIVPTDKPASFEDVFDVYARKETANDDWLKIGTIDKDHLSIMMKNLAENTAYTFKINNQTSPTSNDLNYIIQQFKFETASVKLYDPSLFLEKIEQSLESVVKGVMRAAAGHQALEDPVNISLNEVITKIFLDETLVPNEQYGFDTIALNTDLQLFLGPKQMMLQELKVNETSESSKTHGEIIIHNYRDPERELQPVVVREENGNTRIANIDGDVIIRNVVTDVLLTNEDTRNQLSMNIVGQAFLKGVQGILVVSNFKGIIVVKNVVKS